MTGDQRGGELTGHDDNTRGLFRSLQRWFARVLQHGQIRSYVCRVDAENTPEPRGEPRHNDILQRVLTCVAPHPHSRMHA